MDYIHETREILKEIFCSYWMDDKEIDKIIDETLKKAGTTLEILADIIETAAKNGHSIKEQKEFLSEILT
jgi:hypothetical protein